LNRKPGEKVIVGGVTVTVVEVRDNQVRLAFDAPEEVRILRGEFACGPHEPAEPTFVCEWENAAPESRPAKA
jgi:sRNA-binding carbon storage regulator CsrA